MVAMLAISTYSPTIGPDPRAALHSFATSPRLKNIGAFAHQWHSLAADTARSDSNARQRCHKGSLLERNTRDGTLPRKKLSTLSCMVYPGLVVLVVLVMGAGVVVAGDLVGCSRWTSCDGRWVQNSTGFK